jgi:hypothetical protein
MSKSSAVSSYFRHAGFLVIAAAVLAMADVSIGQANSDEQPASGVSGNPQVASASAANATEGGPIAPKECSDVNNNTACHPENRALPVQSLEFGGPR